MLTRLCGNGLGLLLGTDSNSPLAGAVNWLANGLIHRWQFLGLVGVHLNTVPLNRRPKSKIFLQSCWLVAMASAREAEPMHFL